ncbi:MAG TPA: hypothetical protein VD886_21380 [Herpetosiphonaceae bacterium]|nr:hypothetical protein [Herpetosiphonaceae bacterium]
MIIFFYLIPIAVAATMGVAIWRSGAGEIDPAEKQTMRFLGLNLIEPGINVFAVIGIIALFQMEFVNYIITPEPASGPLWQFWGQALIASSPMALLLLPVLGWNSPRYHCRRINRQLVAIGLLRWGVTTLTFIWPTAIWIGMAVFSGSVWWVNRQAAIFTRRGPARVLMGDQGDPGYGQRRPDGRG